MSEPDFETYASYGVSRESFERLLILEQQLLKWQARINLISPSTISDLWRRHIEDSLQLLPLIDGRVDSIADLGSGGGFPALVLAATQPATVHMYEANGKKAAFLKDALRQMKTKGQVHRERLEPFIDQLDIPKVQIVTARAFAPLNHLLALAEPFFKRGAIGLFHKGQDVDAELNQAAKTWKISYTKHPSSIDSQSVILEVKEIIHVSAK